MSRLRSLSPIVALSVFVACGGGPSATTGSIVGVLKPEYRFSTASLAASGLAEETEFVPGEAIVKFRDEGLFRSQSFESDGMTRLEGLGDATALVRLDRLNLARPQSVGGEPSAVTSSSEAGRSTLEWIANLNARPDVEYAEPNLILKTQAFPQDPPNDPRYAVQWNYPLAHVPEAWRLTTGSSDVVVAVVDTGLVWKGSGNPASHPDLDCSVGGVPKVLPGWDFTDNDGDPFDANPLGGYHGTHVAGTIAACTNNNFGVSGIAPQTRLLPVRVVDGGRATLDKAISGIRWAAGGAVGGAPLNEHPAQVINVSLSGIGNAPQSMQNAINFAASRGSVVVVAAGNNSLDASKTYPANQSQVIVVGAVGMTGEQASYTNTGALVSLVAPGGDQERSRRLGDGVLSTVACSPVPTCFSDEGYAFYQGTSMAAPHISGIVALMMAVSPSLRVPSDAERPAVWTRVLKLLRSTAVPVTSCNRGCGAGLVDARAAVAAAQTNQATGPLLLFREGAVDFGALDTTRQVTLQNVGDTAATVTLSSTGQGISFDRSNVSIAPNSQLSVSVLLNRVLVPLGNSSNRITARDGDTSVNIQAYMENGVGDMGSFRVRLCKRVDERLQRVDLPNPVVNMPYTIRFSDLQPGSYYFMAYHVGHVNADGTVVVDQFAQSKPLAVEAGRETLAPTLQLLSGERTISSEAGQDCPELG